MTEAERALRVDLAAAYRLAERNGWDDTIYTHISAAVPGEPGAYLISPFGLLFEEVCASNLVKVDVHGRKLDGSPYAVNPTGFAIHGAIHAARPSAQCVLHLHTEWGLALSMLPAGLLPTTQHAMRWFGRLGRHAYEGLALDAAQGQRLVAALGELDGLILENHGTLTVGRSVAEAYMLMHHLERAARAAAGHGRQRRRAHRAARCGGRTHLPPVGRQRRGARRRRRMAGAAAPARPHRPVVP